MKNLVDPKKYEEFCKLACKKFGFKDEVASITAKLLVRTDKLGIFSHGTMNLAQYLKKAPVGGIDAKADPTIVKEGSTWAIVDGNNAMGVYNGYYGLKVGIDKAKKTGISYVGIRGSGHYGACGVYAITGAEQGMIALVMSNTVKNMTVTGGKGAIIGNSPISYAIPAGDHRPVFMDIATSSMAGLKVSRMAIEGKTIPENCIVDSEGLPTVDPTVPNWSLVPMAGHKGYCLSFLIEVLCSVLSGGRILDVGLWTDLPTIAHISHSLILIDVNTIMDLKAFNKRMESIIKEISNAPKAANSDRIYLPGEIEWEKYERAEKYGLELPEDILVSARNIADLTGLDFDALLK